MLQKNSLKATLVSGKVLLMSLVLVLSACSAKTETANVIQPRNIYSESIIDITDADRSSCEQAGGIPALTRELNGSQASVCQFANGKRCLPDALNSGRCAPVL